MLGWRIAVSAILIPVLFGIFWLDHRAGSSAPWLFAFCLLLGIRSTWELKDLLTTRTMKPSFAIAAIGVVMVLAAAWMARWFAEPWKLSVSSAAAALFAAVAAAYVCFVAAAVRFREPGTTMETLGAELFAILYCG
ncbi:MAG TPA: phosphatidate cytidylyltransferase, partial [Caulifigura sp.]|nr:phosphatidate cytidylyltransferase [Caulifigura sp.]